MDTSDSEHSQSGEESADDEWVHPMFIGKKRNARKGGRSGSESQSLETDGSESLKREDSVDTVSSGKEKSIHGLCCSCSKQSFCKTMKCECRAVGGNCSESCGCSSNKCSNREDQKVNVEEQDTGSKKNGILPDEVEHAQDLASQGATLLRSALADMPAEQREENCGSRKPLADIGNTTVQSFSISLCLLRYFHIVYHC